MEQTNKQIIFSVDSSPNKFYSGWGAIRASGWTCDITLSCLLPNHQLTTHYHRALASLLDFEYPLKAEGMVLWASKYHPCQTHHLHLQSTHICQMYNYQNRGKSRNFCNTKISREHGMNQKIIFIGLTKSTTIFFPFLKVLYSNSCLACTALSPQLGRQQGAITTRNHDWNTDSVKYVQLTMA